MAEHFGIRVSYWTVVPVLLGALLMTRSLVADRVVRETPAE